MGTPAYSEVITAIYGAALSPSRWPDALELSADYVGADSGMLLHLPASQNNNFIIHRRLREDLNGLFLKYHTRNPYGLAFARAPIGRAVASGELVRNDILHRSAFYADILAPQGISEIIAVRHSHLSQEGPGGVLFNLSKARTDDAEASLRRLDRLKPHLSSAIDATILASNIPSNQEHIHQLLDTVSGAVALLDRDGGVVGMSADAEALLQQCDGLILVRGHQLTLAAQAREEMARFDTAMRHAFAVANGEESLLEGLIQIKRPSGRRSLLIQMIPLVSQPTSPWNAFNQAPRVMVRIVDPQASTEAQAEQLRMLVGLTAGETRVAALIGGGLNMPETARALGLSLSTVKTHAKRVFQKAEVRSSAALVRLLTSIPVGSSS